MKRLAGVDFVVDDAAALPGTDNAAAKVYTLPLEDDAFDINICTHMIDNVLEYHQSLAELRCIAKKGCSKPSDSRPRSRSSTQKS
jgi:hypothetical protein